MLMTFPLATFLEPSTMKNRVPFSIRFWWTSPLILGEIINMGDKGVRATHFTKPYFCQMVE